MLGSVGVVAEIGSSWMRRAVLRGRLKVLGWGIGLMGSENSRVGARGRLRRGKGKVLVAIVGWMLEIGVGQIDEVKSLGMLCTICREELGLEFDKIWRKSLVLEVVCGDWKIVALDWVVCAFTANHTP